MLTACWLVIQGFARDAALKCSVENGQAKHSRHIDLTEQKTCCCDGVQRKDQPLDIANIFERYAESMQTFRLNVLLTCLCRRWCASKDLSSSHRTMVNCSTYLALCWQQVDQFWSLLFTLIGNRFCSFAAAGYESDRVGSGRVGSGRSGCFLTTFEFPTDYPTWFNFQPEG